MIISNKLLGLAAAATVALAATPVLAADNDQVEQIRVARAVVTPASERQAPQALDRLGRAAMEACGASSFSVRDHQIAVRNSACFHDTLAQAVAQVNSPYLNDAYSRRATVEVAQGEGGAATHAR